LTAPDGTPPGIMTQVEYLAEDGTSCPYCGNKNTAVLTSPQLGDGGGTGQDECHDCGKSWDVHYKLSGYATNPHDDGMDARGLFEPGKTNLTVVQIDEEKPNRIQLTGEDGSTYWAELD
jgi:hypothetical protein